MESDSETRHVEDPGAGTWLLILASVAVLASALTLPLGGLTVHFLGYLLASLLAFTCVALFRRRGLERLLAVGVATSTRLNSFALGVLFAGLACSFLNAWFIARHWT